MFDLCDSLEDEDTFEKIKNNRKCNYFKIYLVFLEEGKIKFNQENNKELILDNKKEINLCSNCGIY